MNKQDALALRSQLESWVKNTELAMIRWSGVALAGIDQILKALR
jgi:hypothetical protein